MPIFISYSHQDQKFVEALARQLVQHKVLIWVDRWELNVGDSLISKIQEALSESSALLVILSKASVKSPWCEKEINSGLLRELEERRVVVMPVLVEDCAIPIFLRDKVYADFRTDPDAGLRAVLDSVARVTNPNTGRVDGNKYFSDWAFDWGFSDENAQFRIISMDQAQGQPFSVISTVEITANRPATLTYLAELRNGSDEEYRQRIVRQAIDKINESGELTLVLEDQFELVSDYMFEGDGADNYTVRLSARRLGADTGKDVVYHIGGHLEKVYRHMTEVQHNPSDV